MSFRTKIFIILSIVVLCILAVTIFLIATKEKQEPSDTTPTDQTAQEQIESQGDLPEAINAPPPTTIPASPSVKPMTSEEALKNAAKQLAKIFIERYGTYSSENNGENIRDCESIVTKNLYAEISQRIGVQSPNGEFTAATTKAVAVDLSEYSENEAKAELGVNRITTKGDVIENKTGRANVWMVRSGEGWLVNKFEWVQ